MPKSSRKARPQKGHQSTEQSTQIDFKLADYADAPKSVAGKQLRMKKGAANAWKNNVKGMEGSVASKEDLAWDEKDLSDFEAGGDDSGGEDVDEAGDATGTCSGPSKAKIKKNLDQGERFEGGGVYPPDVWFLVAEWITPESVATFSAICKHSHVIIHTARFWISMYKRFYSEEVSLPLQLRPRFMSKLHGLRTRVVKILFLSYAPFTVRIKSRIPFEEQLDTLEGQTCMVMWYKRVKKSWHFFFKFKKSGRVPCRYTQPDRSQQFWDFEPVISHNDEEDNKVLQVVATNFMDLPVIMGHTLQKAFISVGRDMRYHKLRLIFTQQPGKRMDNNGVVLVIDPVINVRVLRWWDPEYPGNAGEMFSPTTPS